jgi:hypothetical protein
MTQEKRMLAFDWLFVALLYLLTKVAPRRRKTLKKVIAAL